ncbi:mechanosensitive ion channel family protein [Rhodobacter sp. NSM]|uniref:mechanosensitive ion channel family protein n=1 Tax=Rhodobacter sp. NSM TaxID=3457501 RepID=UPI003FCF320E
MLDGLIRDLELFIASLLRPWNLYQIAIVLALALVAHLMAAWAAPRLHAWMRSREGWALWRMRLMVVVHRRLRGIFFVILTQATVWIMRSVTWPSRSYLVAAVASLALAWLIVVFSTRLIANPLLRSAVRYGAWIWVTLRILNLDADVADLLDRHAVMFGTLRVSTWTLVQAVVFVGLFLVLARFLTRITSARVAVNDQISPSMRVLIVKLLQVSLYGAAFVVGLRAVGVDLTGLAFLSGAIGLGLGFGLQKVVSNLVSGVIILLDKSIKPGDVISLGETFGWINALGARYVSITTRDGREFLIPNEDMITNQVVNWTHSDDYVRLDIHFGTSYGDNPHDVRRIAIEAAKGVDRVLVTRAPVCHITGFGESSIDYILRFWIADATGGLTNIRGNVFLALWDAFQANGITIPFPQREVRMLGGSKSAKTGDGSSATTAGPSG